MLIGGKMLKNFNIKHAIIALASCIAGLLYCLSCSETDDVTIETEEKDTNMFSDTNTDDITVEASEKNIYVYITGCVYCPGVYEVSENSRVLHVVEAAGGLNEEADEKSVNMAKGVSDGEHIHIYSVYDGVTDIYIDIDGNKSSLININTATKDELMTLPGIGAARATDIIAYRDKTGGFNSIEDIMLVSGIKEAAFEKIKEYICVE